MLEINSFSLSFRRYKSFFTQENITRLNDINLKINEGEMLAVIGHSGAGKSLLAHAILGLLPQNIDKSGEIFFKNKRLDKKYSKRIRGKEIALLPQQISYLDPTALVGSQIRWAAQRADAEPEVVTRLAAVGLEESTAYLYPHQVSGGMARRVLMAQATAGGAKLLIADEPTAGLDPESRNNMLDKLRKYADDGGAVMLITHDLIPALSRADSVALLNEGELCCFAPTSAFAGKGEALSSAYAQAMWQALPQNGFYTHA
ncbi:Oligopeptide transport ATP-binding protein OppD [Paenochrobactrum sp. BZR 201-1]